MGDAPLPLAPTKTGIAPAVLEGYFKSIQEPFRETRKGRAKGDSHVGVSIFVFIFCLIPLIPYLVYKVMPLLLGPRLISFRSAHPNLTSFWFLWVASFLLSLLLLVIVAKFSGPSKEEKGRWLSPQQMRFASCYGIIDEIQKYKTNHINRHIDNALEYLQETAITLIRSTAVGSTKPIYRYREQGNQFEIMLAEDEAIVMHPGTLPKWYRLRPETELVLKAYSDFLAKLRDRLRDKKDLPAIEAALTALTAYYYTEISEIFDDQSQASFEQLGENSLLTFAQQITGLPPYHSEEQKQTPEEKLSKKIFSFGYKISLPFTHENVLIAFCAWYVLMLLLFCVGFYVAFRLFPPMKMDTTIATAIVGGPITTAVAAVTIPRLGKSRKEQG